MDVDGIESGPLSHFVSFQRGRSIADLHEELFNVLLALIALHIAAILFYVFYQRENLVGAIVTGTRRFAPGTQPTLCFVRSRCIESRDRSTYGAGCHDKLLIFIKRRAGMAPDEFRAYYETTHAKLGEKINAKIGVRHYVRRYLRSLTDGEFDYDVITELWFEDRANVEAAAASLARGELPVWIAEDEERFMDRSKTRFATVAECESSSSSPREPETA